MLKGDLWHCPNRSCRATQHRLGPLLDGFGRHSALDVLRVAWLYAVGMAQRRMVAETRLNKNSVCRLVAVLERILSSFSDVRVQEIKDTGGEKCLVCDETAFSTRKYHRGKRVRAEGSEWAQNITITDRDGGTIKEVVLIPLENRKGDTLIENIAKVAHRYTLLRTDGWRGYNGASAHWGHKRVIHQQNFVAEDGTHTNAAESANALVKRELRQRGGQLGQETEARHRRVKALSQVVNGKIGDSGVFLHILSCIKTFCECA